MKNITTDSYDPVTAIGQAADDILNSVSDEVKDALYCRLRHRFLQSMAKTNAEGRHLMLDNHCLAKAAENYESSPIDTIDWGRMRGSIDQAVADT